jgi:hypothetical protein
MYTTSFVLNHTTVADILHKDLNAFVPTYKGKKVKFRIGALQHRSLKAYCALTPKEFLHSSLEALHTERYTAP